MLPRRVRSILIAATLGLIVIASQSRPAAADEPETKHLVLAGMAMGIPTYFMNVIIHESTHALVAKAFGKEILAYKVLPSFHPRTGEFYFGYVQYRGRLTSGKRTLFLLAPKIPDALYIAVYAALLATDTIPSNRYGRLALAIAGTGFWLDFSKDSFAFWSKSDVVRTFDAHSMHSALSRLPWRVLHLALSAVGAYVVYQGYKGVFEDEDPMPVPLLAPILTGRF